MHDLRNLIGCSSLHSQEPWQGWSAFRQLGDFLAPGPLRTELVSAYKLPAPVAEGTSEMKIPKLLRSYLVVGARIGGAPAWDRAFGTIDFLTLLDLAQLSRAAKNRFLPGPEAVRAASAQVSVD